MSLMRTSIRGSGMSEPAMKRPISRRALLGLAPAALASCARSDGAYFGSTDPPKTRRLVHTLGSEVESLDPAKSTSGWEFYAVPALFEGLVQNHPELPRPMAAL